MKIKFYLIQDKTSKDTKRALKNYFKLELCHHLFSHYTDRINHYRSVELHSFSFESFVEIINQMRNVQILCCDTLPSAKSLTSPELAKKIEDSEISGLQELLIVVGPSNGFSTQHREFLKKKPCLLWSLGPLTLPHDLAAVIASEQIYRAFTILKGEPYHLGH